MNTPQQRRALYPSPDAVDQWIDGIVDLADRTPAKGQLLPDKGFSPAYGVRHVGPCGYVHFTRPDGEGFFGYWQPAHASPAPLLVHVPGYGGEMSQHPDLAAEGYHVLHVNPLGYATPEGLDESRRPEGKGWPVLPETITSGGERGYRDWLADACRAVTWATDRRDVLDHRVSFFGTSQGGGCALLLASAWRGRGVRCVAADQAFLTDFPLARESPTGAYWMAWNTIEPLDEPASAWRALGLIDTTQHVHRLDLPVLLTAGGADQTCPPGTIRSLFDRLTHTRAYVEVRGRGHGYNEEFIQLAKGWFRLYA
jgi:cephalosporin-C deacetylase-like acetyl esterase